MSFRNGPYWLEYKSNLGMWGIGTIHISGARLWGGDGAFTYRGIVIARGGVIKGRVSVDRIDPRAESIFGRADHFELEVSGLAVGNRYTFSGIVVGCPHLRVKFTLRRASQMAAE